MHSGVEFVSEWEAPFVAGVEVEERLEVWDSSDWNASSSVLSSPMYNEKYADGPSPSGGDYITAWKIKGMRAFGVAHIQHGTYMF